MDDMAGFLVDLWCRVGCVCVCVCGCVGDMSVLTTYIGLKYFCRKDN